MFVHSDVCPKNPALVHSDVWDACVVPLRRLGLLRLSTPNFSTPTFGSEPIFVSGKNKVLPGGIPLAIFGGVDLCIHPLQHTYDLHLYYLIATFEKDKKKSNVLS